ncbi:MAG: 2-dehydropantoate 2-reductase N-terminal domain-containing protein [Microvirga sp.]
MRIIIYGVGAIGGTVAAALSLSGREVIGIARGAQLDAIRADGLLLRTPDKEARARFSCVADPSEIAFKPDDAILLTMKTQDTLGALERLRAAGVAGQPIFCVQNGVTNERLALRRFPNVHGVTVMMPAGFEAPGEVNAFSSPRHGIFDVGRYPSGSDADDDALAEAFNGANIAAFVLPDVMASKYGKLIMNLNNILEAALGPGVDAKRFAALLQAEAKAAFIASGIVWHDRGATDSRRANLMQIRPIAGARRAGNSSAQSLARGTGSIETDYLNGEVTLLSRLHGLPCPANDYFVGLSARLVQEKLKPGAVTIAGIEAGLRAAGVSLPA